MGSSALAAAGVGLVAIGLGSTAALLGLAIRIGLTRAATRGA